MNKTFKSFVVLALSAVTMSFASCNNEDEPVTSNQTFQPGQIVSNEAIAALF